MDYYMNEIQMRNEMNDESKEEKSDSNYEEEEENEEEQMIERESEERNEDEERNERKEKTFNEVFNTYLEIKKIHSSGLFTSLLDIHDHFNDEERKEFDEIEDEIKEEMKELMEKEIEWMTMNYNKEMNLYTSVFSYYNKYLSWIYNYHQ